MVKLLIIFILVITLTAINFPVLINGKSLADFTPIAPTEPLAVMDANFVVSQINRLSQEKILKKLLKITKASILLKEYVKLDFTLATTQCKKGDSTPLDRCPVDPSIPFVACKDVVVANQPYREVPIKVTQYNNCEP